MIRQATKADIDPMIELAREMWTESRYKEKGNLDTEKLTELANILIDHKSGIIFVYEVAENIVGMFLGLVEEQFFNRTLKAVDLALYVCPEHRSATIGAKLIQQYVQQAKELGAIDIVIANSTDINQRQVCQLYEAVGFKQVGGVYVY